MLSSYLAPAMRVTPWRVLPAAIQGALAALAVVITLGLLAFSPLGVQAGRIGIAAAFAAVIAGSLVYALFGSSASPAAGPSSATALILSGLVLQLSRDSALDLSQPQHLAALVAVAALAVTLMGLILVPMALLGVGRLAEFVPQTALAGFMNGVALMILVSQVPALLGLPSTVNLTDSGALMLVQPLTLTVGLFTAVTSWVCTRRWPNAPAGLVALCAGSALYGLLAWMLPAAPLGPLVGTLPSGWVLPDAMTPFLNDTARLLVQRHIGAVLTTAAVLALMATFETLIAALALDQIAKAQNVKPHDSRRELLALGFANITSGIFGGLPLTLMRMRAQPMINAGMAGRAAPIVSTVVLAVIFGFGAPLVAHLPKVVLAGVMVAIAMALADRWTSQLLHQVRAGERSSDLAMSVAVVASVCIMTVTMGFVTGVIAGTMLSMMVFIHTMNSSLLRGRYTGAQRPSRRVYGPMQQTLLDPLRQQITLFELEGALFFGSGSRLSAEVASLGADCRVLVLDLRRVSTIDESGAMLLQQLSLSLPSQGTLLFLAGVSSVNKHGHRLRAFGCFRDNPEHGERSDWWPDADRAVEAAERTLLTAVSGDEHMGPIALADTSLLQGLALVQIESVASSMAVQQLGDGDVLFQIGDLGDRVYVLTAGCITVIGPMGQRFVTYSPGAMLGEVALLDSGPRSAAALANGSATVHSLTRESIDRLARVDPAIGQQIMRNIALHLATRLRAAPVV